MRPPKEKWQKTASAIGALYNLIDCIVIEFGETVPVKVLRELKACHIVIKDLETHIDTSEECEQD